MKSCRFEHDVRLSYFCVGPEGKGKDRHRGLSYYSRFNGQHAHLCLYLFIYDIEATFEPTSGHFPQPLNIHVFVKM